MDSTLEDCGAAVSTTAVRAAVAAQALVQATRTLEGTG